MTRKLRRFAGFWRDQTGNVLAISAAVMPLVIGAAAIGVDTIQSSLARRQLQRSADSAALAGAHALIQSQAVAQSVNHDLALNNGVPLSAAPVIENAPTVGPYAGDEQAVRVQLAASREVPFMSFFTSQNMEVRVEATAAIINLGEFCVISLEDSTTSAGVTFTGSTSLDLGCGVATNSRAPAAISAQGSSSISASPISAVGGVPSSGNYGPNTKLLPYSPPQEDPYADLPPPTVPSDCKPRYTQNPNEAPPPFEPTSSGVYCYRGMDIKGTLTLPPNSVIIIDGGTLDFGSQANVTGTGVTFILTSRNADTNPSQIADLSMNGSAVVDVTAPTSGTYAGVLFYQDRRASYGSTTVNGNSASRFQGSFYFPNRELNFRGAAGMRTECFQLIARRLVFSGNSSIQNSCPPGSGSQAFDATFVRLVG